MESVIASAEMARTESRQEFHTAGVSVRREFATVVDCGATPIHACFIVHGYNSHVMRDGMTVLSVKSHVHRSRWRVCWLNF